MRQVTILLCFGLGLILNTRAYAQTQDANLLAQVKSGMVVADNPTAAKIGARILKAGGDAIDAAVATAFALGVVHPFASGIGGGGFAVVHRNDGSEVAFDFREVAPQRATQNMFVDEQGKIVSGLSRHSALAVAVPGEVAGLYHMHKRYGKLPWSTLVNPSIQLARNGLSLRDLASESERRLVHMRRSVLFPFMVREADKGMLG